MHSRSGWRASCRRWPESQMRRKPKGSWESLRSGGKFCLQVPVLGTRHLGCVCVGNQGALGLPVEEEGERRSRKEKTLLGDYLLLDAARGTRDWNPGSAGGTGHSGKAAEEAAAAPCRNAGPLLHAAALSTWLHPWSLER